MHTIISTNTFTKTHKVNSINIDSESSGRIITRLDTPVAFDGAFTDFEELPSSGYNILMRAQRYGKYFVLKALHPSHRDDPYYLQLLRKEFDIAISLNHPNIIRVYSLEEVEPLGPCIVMAYIDGLSLDQYLATNPSVESRKRVTRQILDALDYSHSQQVIHRDIKPSNILVTKNGNNAYIIDYGLSDADYYAILKEPAFSRRYASPEQLDGLPTDCRTDIYSFGLLLRDIFPHRYRRIARRCCQPLRHKRYANAATVAKAIFSPWRTLGKILMVLIAVAAMYMWWYAYHHTNTDTFLTTAPTGQTLRCRIAESQAHILGGDDIRGHLAIPATVKHGLRRYPVVAIDQKAFYFQLGLTHITLPEGLLMIDEGAFMQCTNLTDTLILPRSLRHLRHSAFCGTGFTHVIVRSRHIDDNEYNSPCNIFMSCEQLEHLYIEPSVVHLGRDLLSCSYIRHIHLPYNWTEVPDFSFSYIANILSIHMSPRTKVIGTSAFYSNGIARLVLPDSVTTVKGYAFRWAECHYLEFGSQIKHIGPSALANMVNLDTLVIRAPEPPDCGPVLFEETNTSKVTLMVPASSVPRYQADPNFAPLRIVPLKEGEEE